jgi:hypothetical protein
MAQEHQSYKNHVRFDPPFHFVAMPLIMVATVYALSNAILLEGRHTAWVVVVLCLGTIVAAALVRLNSLKVQDRVIKLEVALRYERLSGGKSFESLAMTLTVPQIVALRFAGDEELVTLAEKAAAEGLNPVTIKESITHWRGDYYRV